MRAMLLDAPGTKLREAEIRRPELRPGEVRLRARACGTDLYIRDGELVDAKLPLVLGHLGDSKTVSHPSGPQQGEPAAPRTTAS